MKKLLILALVVTIAGAAFADTDPVFSGSFSVYYGYSFTDSDFVESQSDKIALDLNATIDEFNSVSAKVGLANALHYDDGPGGDLDDTYDFTAAETGSRGDYLRMDEFFLTTDLTGALGVDGPVGVTLEFGKYSLASSDVAGKAASSYDFGSKTAADLGIGADISILDMVTLSTVLYPGSWIDDEEVTEFAVTLKAMGIADMIDFAAFFVLSGYNAALKDNGVDKDDTNGDSIGASVGVDITDSIGVGATFEYDMSAGDVAMVALNAGFGLGDLDLGLSYKIGDFGDLMASMAVKLSASYMLMEK